MTRRLLLITYYFPPCGGAAVQRWLRWLPELVHAGYQVDVLTISEGDYPFRDESLLQRIPPEVKVHRTPAPRVGRYWKLLFGKGSSLPYGSLSRSQDDPPLKRLLIWIRLNLIVPDMRVFWNARAGKLAGQLLRMAPYTAVITSGPPHSTHLLGLKLKKAYGVRWFADWRDPWTGIYYLKLNPPSRLSMLWHKRLEKSVAEGADLNLCVSRYLAAEIPSNRKLVLYNGYDARYLPVKRSTAPGGDFRIKYIGQITEGQDTGALVDIISALASQVSVQLSFVGTQLDEAARTIIASISGISLREVGFVPHKEALQEMADAELLVLMINDYEGYEGMLTTKLFEYLGTGNPILSIGPHGGEAEQLLLEHRAGRHFDSSEKDLAVAWVLEMIQMRLRGESYPKGIDLDMLSAQHQSLMLIDALREEKSS